MKYEATEIIKQSTALENVKEKGPLTHCITNFVTVNDCANAILAIGAFQLWLMMMEKLKKLLKSLMH